ncbi:hypothetical protein ABPG74_007846 [Tetrahymena malaccensis]
MKHKEQLKIDDDNNQPKRDQLKQLKEEITDTDRSLNVISKITNQNKLNTVSSSHSIDENPNQINHPSCIQSDATTRKNDFSFCHQQKSGEFIPKYAFGRPKPSLKESLNEKPSIIQINNQQNQKKIFFKISWTPINQCFCCCLIGHVGISNSQGVVYDFKNHFFIGADIGDEELRLFGRPTKDLYLELDSEEQAARLQEVLKNKQVMYTTKEAVVGRYKFLKNNCHHFVADVLNTFRYKNKSNYTAWWVWKQTLFHAKYRNFKGCLRTYSTPLVLILLGILFLIFFLIDHFLELGLLF